MTEKNKQQNSASLGKGKPDTLGAEIGRRISQARSGMGLSQQAVSTRSAMLDADGIGISRATLSLYETGILPALLPMLDEGQTVVEVR